MGLQRCSCTILLPKQQRHSREVLSCTWDESWLHWCWVSPWALSTLRCKALLILHGMHHKSSGSLKDLPAGSVPAWSMAGRDWIVLHWCKHPLPGQAPELGWEGWGELQPAPRAVTSTVPSSPPSNRCFLGQVLLFSGPLLCRRLKKNPICNKTFGLLKWLHMLHERHCLVAESVTTPKGSF